MATGKSAETADGVDEQQAHGDEAEPEGRQAQRRAAPVAVA